MKVKGLGVLVIVLILGIILLGVVSSLTYNCEFKPISQCTGSLSNIVMRISDISNAHGELASNYQYAICCNYAGNNTCTGSNKIIGLSSTTNAHAEIPSLSNYATPACYTNLSCVSRDDYTCNSTYYLSLFSLTNQTNAHISMINDERYKICCKNIGEPDISETCASKEGTCCIPNTYCTDKILPYSCASGTCCSSSSCCVPQDRSSTCVGSNPPKCGEWPESDCGGIVKYDCDYNATHECQYATTCCNSETQGRCVNDGDPCSGKQCGNFTNICGDIENCGSCIPSQVCDPNGQCCTPKTCEDFGYQCGTHDDGCSIGNTIYCGSCPNKQGYYCIKGKCEQVSGCELLDAYWKVPRIDEGLPADLEIITTLLCEGEFISSVLIKDSNNHRESLRKVTNPSFIVDNTGKKTLTWKAEYRNVSGYSNKYYIETTLQGKGTIKSNERGDDAEYYSLLEVIDNSYIEPTNCSLITLCKDYTNKTQCEGDTSFCEVAENSVRAFLGIETSEKYCGVEYCGYEPDRDHYYDGCRCVWNSTSNKCGVSFSKTSCYDDAECGNGIIETDEECDVNALPFTNCGIDPPRTTPNVDNCTGGTVSCKSDCTLDTSSCTGCYPWGFCGDGIINSQISPGDYEVCDGDDWGSVIGCDDFDLIGDGLRCDETCHFDTSGCFGIKGFDPGTCNGFEESTNECDENPIGFYIINWSGTWEWDSDNKGWTNVSHCVGNTSCDYNYECVDVNNIYYCDPERGRDACLKGESVMACPSGIKLPFFDKHSLIITILIIYAIYAFLDYRKNRKRVRLKKVL